MSRYNHADKLLDLYFPVLDNGFISVKDYFGSDEAIECAARVSYQSGTRQVSDRRNLLRYLMRHNHSSPLEQASITFHMRLPLFVIQQLLRHRTAKLNQESFRYSEVPDIKNVVGEGEWRLQSTNNKQGSFGQIDDQLIMNELRSTEIELHNLSNSVYNMRLERGVAREQARKDIPVSTYSSMYWTMDVRNLLHFMSLRCDSHAQLEIRMYANVIAGLVKEIFPIVFEAWYDYVFGAVNFTRLDRKFLVQLIGHYQVDDFANVREQYLTDRLEYHKEVGMGERELAEFWDKVTVPDEKDFTLDVSTAKTADEMTVE